MRSLTDEEAKVFFQKLSRYIGSNVKHLLVREDEEYVFRLHKERVYYIKRALLRLASTVGTQSLDSQGRMSSSTLELASGSLPRAGSSIFRSAVFLKYQNMLCTRCGLDRVENSHFSMGSIY